LRVLVIGSGGREHALCWRLARSPSVEEVFVCPGNAGMHECATVLPIAVNDFSAIASACFDLRVDWVLIGPEKPLISGITDYLKAQQICVYGPTAKASQIEGSKSFAKQLMHDASIPTAHYQVYTDFNLAKDYIEDEFALGCPVVVKASGDALGKGVFVCDTAEEAIEAAHSLLVRRDFGEAGDRIVVEQRLEGDEISLLAVCNGNDYRIFPVCRDYKRAFDGDCGPNTGGMGAVSPPNHGQAYDVDTLGKQFIAPVLKHLQALDTPYIGTLYAGLIITDSGPYALEYNCRFGDPETQAIVPLLENDFGELLYSAALGKSIPEIKISDLYSAVVVIASKGYPGEYVKDLALPKLNFGDALVFHAGTALKDGALVSNGGRVLNVVGVARTLDAAIEVAYKNIGPSFGNDWHYRTDIGRSCAHLQKKY
jgi:phosphoribosylamine--glycine ligase